MPDSATEFVQTDDLAHGAVTVATTPTLIRDTRRSRVALLIQNSGTTGDLYLGDLNVTTATGVKVVPGGSFEEREFTGPVYGAASAGTIDTRYWETG